MEPVVLALLVAAGVCVAAGLVVWCARAGVDRRRLEGELRAARADLDALRQRVDRLDRPGRSGDGPDDQDRHDDHHTDGHASEYLITSLGDPVPGEALEPRLTGREFVDVALGESLLRVAAFAHGVRRAASPESRNRIRFEMAREVKRVRRQRRQDLKEARRHLRTQQLRREDDAAMADQDAA